MGPESSTAARNKAAKPGATAQDNTGRLFQGWGCHCDLFQPWLKRERGL